MTRGKWTMFFCGLVTACQAPSGLRNAPQPEDVVSVAELQENRLALRGRTVRVEGFLMEEQQSFVLVEGRARDAQHIDERRRFTSWCLADRPVEPLWINKEDLRRTWWSIRPPNRNIGLHVVVEGVFDDENIPPLDEQGRSNGRIWMGRRDAFPVPGDYLGMGPLRDARIVRLLPNRCSGLGGPGET